MTRCRTCKHRIWPWQSISGWGPIGFRNREDSRIEHTACVRDRARARHAAGQHGRHPIVCSVFGCTKES